MVAQGGHYIRSALYVGERGGLGGRGRGRGLGNGGGGGGGGNGTGVRANVSFLYSEIITYSISNIYTLYAV